MLAVDYKDNFKNFSSKKKNFDKNDYIRTGGNNKGRLEFDNPAYNVTIHTELLKGDHLMNGKKYLRMIAEKGESVTMHTSVLGGMPVVKGTRIQVSLIIACLKDGMGISEICEDYSLDYNEVLEALEYTIRLLETPFVEE